MDRFAYEFITLLATSSQGHLAINVSSRRCATEIQDHPITQRRTLLSTSSDHQTPQSSAHSIIGKPTSKKSTIGLSKNQAGTPGGLSVPRSPPKGGFEVRNHPPKHILELYKSPKIKIHGTGFMINSNALKYLVRTFVLLLQIWLLVQVILQ
jgi:hypothetical protein